MFTVNKIETGRLWLREVTPEVYNSVFTLYKDDEIKTFFGFQSDDELFNEKDRYKKGITAFNKSFVIFYLLEKESEKVIGWCGFHSWYFLHCRAEIGYGLYEEKWRGKGLMNEAIKPVLEYGFEKMKLNRVEALIGPDNIPSLQLIRGLGFQEEGVLREHYCKNNVLEDSILFSLLKKDYDLENDSIETYAVGRQ